MSGRAAPWRTHPPQEVFELMQQVPNTVMYLVHRSGPTSFIVREDGHETKRKVTIGSRLSCTCSSSGLNGNKELCLHVLFTMLKILRVPASNPLVWQLSLTDRELDEVLQCSSLPQAPPPRTHGSHAHKGSKKLPPGEVERRPLEEGEESPCPICYEDMAAVDLDMLVYCRAGCGANVHGKCLGIWADHQTRSLGKELSCPLCRTAWGEFKWRPPPPKKRVHRREAGAEGSHGSNLHMGSKCGVCKMAPINGKRFRCFVCADFDLCEGCFGSGQHAQHPFACRATPTAFPVPADRPVLMPTATRMGVAAPAPHTAAHATSSITNTTGPSHPPPHGDGNSSSSSPHAGQHAPHPAALAPAVAAAAAPAALAPAPPLSQPASAPPPHPTSQLAVGGQRLDPRAAAAAAAEARAQRAAASAAAAAAAAAGTAGAGAAADARDAAAGGGEAHQAAHATQSIWRQHIDAVPTAPSSTGQSSEAMASRQVSQEVGGVYFHECSGSSSEGGSANEGRGGVRASSHRAAASEAGGDGVGGNGGGLGGVGVGNGGAPPGQGRSIRRAGSAGTSTAGSGSLSMVHTPMRARSGSRPNAGTAARARAHALLPEHGNDASVLLQVQGAATGPSSMHAALTLPPAYLGSLTHAPAMHAHTVEGMRASPLTEPQPRMTVEQHQAAPLLAAHAYQLHPLPHPTAAAAVPPHHQHYQHPHHHPSPRHAHHPLPPPLLRRRAVRRGLALPGCEISPLGLQGTLDPGALEVVGGSSVPTVGGGGSLGPGALEVVGGSGVLTRRARACPALPPGLPELPQGSLQPEAGAAELGSIQEGHSCPLIGEELLISGDPHHNVQLSRHPQQQEQQQQQQQRQQRRRSSVAHRRAGAAALARAAAAGDGREGDPGGMPGLEPAGMLHISGSEQPQHPRQHQRQQSPHHQQPGQHQQHHQQQQQQQQGQHRQHPLQQQQGQQQQRQQKRHKGLATRHVHADEGAGTGMASDVAVGPVGSKRCTDGGGSAQLPVLLTQGTAIGYAADAAADGTHRPTRHLGSTLAAHTRFTALNAVQQLQQHHHHHHHHLHRDHQHGRQSLMPPRAAQHAACRPMQAPDTSAHEQIGGSSVAGTSASRPMQAPDASTLEQIGGLGALSQLRRASSMGSEEGTLEGMGGLIRGRSLAPTREAELGAVRGGSGPGRGGGGGGNGHGGGGSGGGHGCNHDGSDGGRGGVHAGSNGDHGGSGGGRGEHGGSSSGQGGSGGDPVPGLLLPPCPVPTAAEQWAPLAPAPEAEPHPHALLPPQTPQGFLEASATVGPATPESPQQAMLQPAAPDVPHLLLHQSSSPLPPPSTPAPQRGEAPQSQQHVPHQAALSPTRGLVPPHHRQEPIIPNEIVHLRHHDCVSTRSHVGANATAPAPPLFLLPPPPSPFRDDVSSDGEDPVADVFCPDECEEQGSPSPLGSPEVWNSGIEEEGAATRHALHHSSARGLCRADIQLQAPPTAQGAGSAEPCGNSGGPLRRAGRCSMPGDSSGDSSPEAAGEAAGEEAAGKAAGEAAGEEAAGDSSRDSSPEGLQCKAGKLQDKGADGSEPTCLPDSPERTTQSSWLEDLYNKSAVLQGGEGAAALTPPPLFSVAPPQSLFACKGKNSVYCNALYGASKNADSLDW